MKLFAVFVTLALLFVQGLACVQMHVTQIGDGAYNGDILYNNQQACWIHKSVAVGDVKRFDCRAGYQAFGYQNMKGLWFFSNGAWAVMTVKNIDFLKNRGGEPIGMDWKLLKGCEQPFIG